MRETFLHRMQEEKVTYSNTGHCLPLLGVCLWATPLIFYVVALSRAIMDSARAALTGIWIVNVCLHVAIGGLVVVDATTVSGTFWPLQTAIIGLATYVTFSLPALCGYYLSRDDNVGVALTLLALASACVSNAVLISMLFEYFHRSVRRDSRRVRG